MGKVAVIFVENKAGNPEGIAEAMARVVNAVIGKKNKTWLAILCMKRRHHPPLRRITAPIPGAEKNDEFSVTSSGCEKSHFLTNFLIFP